MIRNGAARLHRLLAFCLTLMMLDSLFSDLKKLTKPFKNGHFNQKTVDFRSKIW